MSTPGMCTDCSIAAPLAEHTRCHSCLGPRHFLSGTCRACKGLPWRELPGVQEETGDGGASRASRSSSPRSVSCEQPTRSWAERAEDTDEEVDYDAVDIFASDEDEERTGPASEEGLYPIIRFPAILVKATERLGLPLPPQPVADEPNAFRSSLLGKSRPSKRPRPVCPAIAEVTDLVQRGWSRPLANRAAARSFWEYGLVHEQKLNPKLPVIEDGIRLSLNPTSSMWTPKERAKSYPGEKDRFMADMLGRAYSNNARIAAMLNNLTLLNTSVTAILKKGEVPSPEELTEVADSTAIMGRMIGAAALHTGAAMCAAQVAMRHMWLAHSDLQAAGKRELLDLPLSSESLFGPHIQETVERMEAAKRTSTQLATHLRLERERPRYQPYKKRGRREDRPRRRDEQREERPRDRGERPGPSGPDRTASKPRGAANARWGHKKRNVPNFMCNKGRKQANYMNGKSMNTPTLHGTAQLTPAGCGKSSGINTAATTSAKPMVGEASKRVHTMSSTAGKTPRILSGVMPACRQTSIVDRYAAQLTPAGCSKSSGINTAATTSAKPMVGKASKHVHTMSSAAGKAPRILSGIIPAWRQASLVNRSTAQLTPAGCGKSSGTNTAASTSVKPMVGEASKYVHTMSSTAGKTPQLSGVTPALIQAGITNRGSVISTAVFSHTPMSPVSARPARRRTAVGDSRRATPTATRAKTHTGPASTPSMRGQRRGGQAEAARSEELLSINSGQGCFQLGPHQPNAALLTLCRLARARYGAQIPSANQMPPMHSAAPSAAPLPLPACRHYNEELQHEFGLISPNYTPARPPTPPTICRAGDRQIPDSSLSALKRKRLDAHHERKRLRYGGHDPGGHGAIQPFPAAPPADGAKGLRGRVRKCSPTISAANNGLLSSLERASSAPIQMVGQDTAERVRPTVPGQSPSISGNPANALAKYRGSHHARGGDHIPPTAGRNKGGPTQRSKCGALLPILPGPQTHRRRAANTGPTRSKQAGRTEAFPHADNKTAPALCGQRRLDDVDRPKGCVLSHPHRKTTQEAPTFCFRREMLRVPAAPVRILASPPHVHQNHRGSSGTSEKAGDEDSNIPGRLAHPSQVETGGPGANPGNPGAHHTPRVCHKLGKELSRAIPSDSIPGLTPGLAPAHSQAVRREATGPNRAEPDSPQRRLRLTQTAAHPAGHDGGSRRRGTARPPSHEGAPKMGSPPHKEKAPQPRMPSYTSRSVAGHCLLVGPSSAPKGGQTGPGRPLHRNLHGRIPNRVGWRLGEGVCWRNLATAKKTHKPAGDGGSEKSAPPLCRPNKRQAHHDTLGQHIGRSVPEQTGRNKIPFPVQPVKGGSAVGTHPPRLAEGPPHCREEKCGSRQDVQGRRPSRRMEHSPGHSSENLASLRGTDSRPLCERGERALPALVLPEEGGQSPTRGGRPSPQRVAEGPALRLPTDQAATGSPSTDREDEPGRSGDRPGQSQSQMVSQVDEPGDERAMGDPGQGRCSPSSGGDLVLPPGFGPPPDGLEAERQRLRELGLAPAVVNTIQRARAPSTSKAYAGKWRFFEGWCQDRGIDPVSCPIHGILEFLQSLLEKGRAAATLNVFASAITTGHKGFGTRTARNHPLVKKFLKGARRIRPPTRRTTPTWNLQTVLDGLSGPPFEPLATADIGHLSYKVAFLLAICSTKRAGDLCALSTDPSCMVLPDGPGIMELRPNPAFQPKVITSSFRSQVIKIHSFFPPPHNSGEEERQHRLCPVRAVRHYVDRTAVFRRSRQLFIKYSDKGKGDALSTQRFAHWIGLAIKLAYEAKDLAPPASVRAHSTRSVGSSMALLRGSTAEDICLAASWSSTSTFVQSYLLDMAAGSVAHTVLSNRTESRDLDG